MVIGTTIGGDHDKTVKRLLRDFIVVLKPV